MLFGGKKKRDAARAKDLADQQKELDRHRRLAESQRALMNAALTTADTAQEVTNKLRSRLDDIVTQFDATSRLLKDSLVICNVLGEITAFNPAAEKMFDMQHDNAIGKPVVDLFRAANGDPINDLASLWVMLKNEDQDDVVGVRGRKRFPIQTSLSMLDRHDGSSVILLLIQDQSEQKKHARTKNHYDTMFATSFDGVLVTHKGRIVAANPAACRLFGYPVDSLLREPVSMLVNVRDRERVSSSRLLPTGMTSQPQQFLIDGIHSTTKALNLMFASTPIEWDDDAAVLITVKDVTELQRLEGVLGVKQVGGEMIVCFDTSYRITFANGLFIERYAPGHPSLVGDDVRHFIPPEEMDVFSDNARKLSVDVSSIRSHTQHTASSGFYFQDWIDNGVFNTAGDLVEYQRVGRTINEALAQAIVDQETQLN